MNNTNGINVKLPTSIRLALETEDKECDNMKIPKARNIRTEIFEVIATQKRGL